MASFDADALRDNLRPLVPGGPVEPTPGADAYLRHYGIHFKESLPGTSHQFGYVESDTHRIAVHVWTPAQPRGCAVVLHGYYDHVGLYGHLFRHLLERGLRVVTFDLPGHGLSSGEQATIDTFDHYVDAFESVMRTLEHYLPQPWYLLGQSTGGAVAMEWLLSREVTRETNPFSKVVLLAPLVRPHRWPLARIAYVLGRPFLRQRPRVFRSNADNADFIRFLRDDDPLQARILPVRWVTSMVTWRRRFEAYPPTDIAPLVIQGQRDTTVDWRYNIKVIGRLFRPRVFYIEQARHHLVNESPEIRTQIFKAIDGELQS